MKKLSETIDLEKWISDYENNYYMPKHQSMWEVVSRRNNKKVDFFKKDNDFRTRSNSPLTYAIHLLKGSNKKSLDWCMRRFKRRFNDNYSMHSFYSVFNDASWIRWNDFKLKIVDNIVYLEPLTSNPRYRSLVVNGETKFFDHKTNKWKRTNHEFQQKEKKFKKVYDYGADAVLKHEKIKQNKRKRDKRYLKTKSNYSLAFPMWYLKDLQN